MATSLEYLGNRTSSKTAAPQGSLRSGQQRLWFMIALIISTPLLACFFSFQMAESSWFRRNADPQWIRSSDRVYTAHNVPCDVLVYGDSTAITGIDPAVVQRLTGLRTCNIAQTKGVLVVLGTTGLDIFLSHNPKPRYLLLQFSGADLYQPRSWLDTTAYMEGVVPLLRYYPKHAFLVAVARHPEIFMGMMHYAYISGPLNWWINRTRFANWTPNTPLVDVHFVRPEPAFKDCSETTDIDPAFHKPEQTFVRQLREKYSGAADHLVVDVAPLSACDDKFDEIARALHGMNNSLERYPVNLYNEGYTHYTRQGAERLSEEIAKQIESLRQGSSKAPTSEDYADNVSGVR
jgi:hypothetical protein